VDIIFIARHTDVQDRFRQHARAKLARIEKLDSRAISVDVEVGTERNPRQSDHKERVELTVISKGPPIRAEAAAEDRFAALDLAMAKLESRLRRACDRRKDRHGAHAAVRLSDLPEADLASGAEAPAVRLGAGGGLLASNGAEAIARMAAAADEAESRLAAEPDSEPEDVIRLETQGDAPLVVREKFHAAIPMNIDQALFEMELVGHDFFLFTDAGCGMPSVVYRRRGYQYGVIRLVEEHAPAEAGTDQPAVPESSGHPALGIVNGHVKKAAAGTEPATGAERRIARDEPRRAAGS
jgi:ribosomal subunit interface protein